MRILLQLICSLNPIGLNPRLRARAVHQGPLLAELESNIFTLLGLSLPKAHDIRMVAAAAQDTHLHAFYGMRVTGDGLADAGFS